MWSRLFSERLQADGQLFLRYYLEIVRVAGAPGGSGPLAEEIVGSPTFQPQRLQVQTWASTVGGFTVDILSDDLPDLLQVLRRGSVLSLSAGFPGWDRSAFQRIALGRARRLYAIQGLGPVYRLECLDLFSSLVSRPEDSAPADIPLFAGVGSADTLGAGYSVGDASLTVNDLSLYEKDTASDGLVKVTPNSGDPFYLTWSSKSGSSGAGTLTLSTPGADRYGTTRASASSGNTVATCALVRGHPLNIVRRICLSTGLGTNGSYDTLPDTWGLGLPDHLWDHADTNRYEALVDHSGTYEWSLLVDAELSNGFSTIRSLLQPAGLFLTIHEGQLSARAVQSLRAASVDTGVHLTPAHIQHDSARRIRYEAWAPEASYEYGIVNATGPTTTRSASSTKISSGPALKSYDLSLESVAWHSESDVLDEARDRLRPWLFAVPEWLSLPLAGWAYAGLCPGGVVRVTHPQLPSRLGGGYLNGRLGLVLAVSPGWTGPGPEIEIALCPDDDSPY